MGLMRNIDPALLAAMSAPVWHPVLLVELDWPTGWLRMHSCTGDIEWRGVAWKGVGEFGEVAAPGEAVGLSARPLQMSLYGLPDAVLDQAHAPIRNRPAALFVGAVDEAGGATLIGEPYPLVVGYSDALRFTMRRQGGQTQHGLQLDVGVGPSARAQAAVMHSAEDQAAKFPGDTAGRWLIDARRRLDAMTWPET